MWVIGTLRIARTSNDMADAVYRLDIQELKAIDHSEFQVPEEGRRTGPARVAAIIKPPTVDFRRPAQRSPFMLLASMGSLASACEMDGMSHGSRLWCPMQMIHPLISNEDTLPATADASEPTEPPEPTKVRSLRGVDLRNLRATSEPKPAQTKARPTGQAEPKK